jgi:hypothetical protein
MLNGSYEGDDGTGIDNIIIEVKDGLVRFAGYMNKHGHLITGRHGGFDATIDDLTGFFKYRMIECEAKNKHPASKG